VASTNGSVRKMPLPLRMVAASRRLGSFRGQARVGVTLARRYASPDDFQVGADGFALRIDPDDEFQALMLLGLFDRELVDCVREHARPGSIVVDCGANIGYIALHAARAVGPGGAVEAFECDTRALDRLRDHVRINDAPINIRELAVWDRSGPVEFHLSGQLGWSSVREGAADERGQSEVMAITLDEHLAAEGIDPGRISLIKLDIEGAEPEALKGASNLLDEGSPVLVIETDVRRARQLDREPTEVFDQLAEHGYRAMQAVGGNSADPIADALSRGGPTDVVFRKS
jgi:FkbM family methyltransferase